VAQIESVVEPNCIGDNVRPESVALIGIHGLILAQIEVLIWQYHCDASFSQQVFDIAMAQAIRWESVAFINSHQPILPISASELGDTIGIHSSVLAIWES
jgi:hypothetical protein